MKIFQNRSRLYQKVLQIKFWPEIQFSGIWYLKASKNSGDLLFLNRPENSDSTNLFQYIDDPLSWVNYRITPEDNKLILFPSTLVHLVEPCRSDQDRISVAFNVSLI